MTASVRRESAIACGIRNKSSVTNKMSALDFATSVPRDIAIRPRRCQRRRVIDAIANERRSTRLTGEAGEKC